MVPDALRRTPHRLVRSVLPRSWIPRLPLQCLSRQWVVKWREGTPLQGCLASAGPPCSVRASLPGIIPCDQPLALPLYASVLTLNPSVDLEIFPFWTRTFGLRYLFPRLPEAVVMRNLRQSQAHWQSQLTEGVMQSPLCVSSTESFISPLHPLPCLSDPLH